MKIFKKILNIIILIACVGYIIHFFWTNRDSIEVAFQMGPTLFVSLLATVIVYYISTAYRFLIIVRKCSGQALGFYAWFKVFILGRFLNLFVPQAGNVYRAMKLKTDHNISITRYIASFSSFAWMDTTFNLFCASIIILILNPGLKIENIIAWQIMAVFTVILILAPIIAERILRRMRFKNRWLNWLSTKLSEVLTVTLANLKDPKFLFDVIALGIFVLIVTAGFFYLSFYSFDIHMDLPTLSVFYALFKLGSIVNITPGNIGVQEVAYGFLADSLGIGMAKGILVALFIRVFGTAIGMLLTVTTAGNDLLEAIRNKK